MKKTLFFTLISLFAVLVTKAQADIVLVNYEAGTNYQDRTGAWKYDSLKLGIPNPLVDGLNSSAQVASYHITTQWDDAVTVDNFDEPVSLYEYPVVKMKVHSDSAVSKVVNLTVIDINGYEKSVNVTLPDTVNTSWVDVEFDFSDIALNTPITLISSIMIRFDFGGSIPANNQHNIYYFDDITFSGPQLNVDGTTEFRFFSEKFSDNAWWMSIDLGGGHYASQDSTLGKLRTSQWGSSALTASENHYTSTDSLVMEMISWSGNGIAKFFPSSERVNLSYLEVKELMITGYKNLSFTYDLQWVTAPASYSDAPTIEYSLDGGAWTEVTTSSTLPTATGSWVTDLTYHIGVTGDNLMLRIKNNTTGICYVDNLKLTGTLIDPSATFVSSIDVETQDGTNAIDVKGATKQMVATVLPSTAKQSVFWSLINETGKATLSTTGELTALKNGTVKVVARALDLKGTVRDTQAVVLTNQVYPVTSISIIGSDTLKTSVGSEDYVINLTPSDADTLTYTISLVDSSDAAVSPSIATIDENGTLTAVGGGYAIIKVVADDYMHVSAQKTVVIKEIDKPTGLTIHGEGDVSEITTNAGTLQMVAVATPQGADNDVTWSIAEGDEELATISGAGLLTAKKNGTVTVVAQSTSVDTISAETDIIISGQIILVTEVTVTSEGDATTIDSKGGTLQLTASVTPSDATDNSVTWEVSDENLASVSQTGLVTAIADGAVTVTATAADAGGVSGTFDITISNQSVGLNSNKINTIEIYPNPVKENLVFRNIETGSVIEIINSSGQLILKTKVLKQDYILNVQNLKDGTYMVRTIMKNTVYTSMFIKR